MWGEPPVTDGFPAQRVINTESVSMSWPCPHTLWTCYHTMWTKPKPSVNMHRITKNACSMLKQALYFLDLDAHVTRSDIECSRTPCCLWAAYGATWTRSMSMKTRTSGSPCSRSVWGLWWRTALTYLPLVPDICVRESGQHWFRWWLVACSAPSHYLNQCFVIVN